MHRDKLVREYCLLLAEADSLRRSANLEQAQGKIGPATKQLARVHKELNKLIHTMTWLNISVTPEDERKWRKTLR